MSERVAPCYQFLSQKEKVVLCPDTASFQQLQLAFICNDILLLVLVSKLLPPPVKASNTAWMAEKFDFMGVTETQRSLWIAVKNMLLSLVEITTHSLF